ncbi:MAG TPA: hypothetical protein VL069_15205 [Opitutus sp.]|nr:hypothetical protein [Opitutus sp.]
MKKVKKPRRDPFATAASLSTVGQWLRFAEKLYAREKLALGQIATNAHDEALYLLLRTLDLSLESDARVLAKNVSALEREKLCVVFRRRAIERETRLKPTKTSLCVVGVS